MATGRRDGVRTFAPAVVGLILGGGAPGAAAVDWRQPWVEPRDPVAAVRASDEYAWRIFVAINWPVMADGMRADPGRALGADGPVVWETWAAANVLFRTDGHDPGPWARLPRVSGLPTGVRFETGTLGSLPNLRRVAQGQMEAVTDPLADATRLTEIHFSPASYDYIRRRGLYNLEGQQRAYASREPVEFPSGATQVKAKWRPIAAAERGDYHTLDVTFADGARHLYGLTALHVARKARGRWFWATFEHVGNATRADGEGWQLASRDAFACAGEPSDCNRAPRGIGLEGTVWQNYRLRGTLTAFVDAAGRATRLANSELERGFQDSASCMTCHARAAYSVVDGTVLRLPVFEHDETGVGRRGSLGVPDPAWFVSPLSSKPATVFRPTDFVWSLAKARSGAPAGAAAAKPANEPSS